MKLTGPEIQRRVSRGEDIVIEPFDPNQVNPNSYDLRLSSRLLVYNIVPTVNSPYRSDLVSRIYDTDKARREWAVDRRNRGCGVGNYRRVNDRDNKTEHIELAEWSDVLDMAANNPTYELEIPESGLVLVPGRLYIGSTVEYTETRNLVPCIDGKSSIGRLGINIHVTAGFGDVGFKGTWTLEITAVEPVRIYPNVRFCQISYEQVVGEIQEYQSKKYQGQRTPRASQAFEDFKQ